MSSIPRAASLNARIPRTNSARILRHCREKCRATIITLTEEKACQRCQWGSLDPSFAELLLHSMRHVQHRAAQLNLLLRQHIDSAPGCIKRTEAPLNAG